MLAKLAILVALLVPVGSYASVASLRIHGELSTFIVRIDEDPATGYQFHVQCVERCLAPLEYREPIGDEPLGLFKRWDGDDLVYSLWAAGSVYRVRVWSISDRRVGRLFEEASRGRPDFVTLANGDAAIRTYERPVESKGRDSGATVVPILWRYHAGHFTRLKYARPQAVLDVNG